MRFLVFIGLAMVAMTSAAFAQELPSTTVEVQNLADFAITILQLVVMTTITVGLPMAFAKWSKRTGLEIEQKDRDALQTTLTNAAGGLLQRLGDSAKTLKLDVGNADLAAAIRRVEEGAPDTLRKIGLTEEQIAKRILEKIPQIQQAVEKPAAAPVTPAPAPFLSGNL
jgi:hypothetical protein